MRQMFENAINYDRVASLTGSELKEVARIFGIDTNGLDRIKDRKSRRKKLYTYDVIEQAKNFAREHGGRVDKYEGITTTYVFTAPGYKTQVYIYYGIEQGQQVYTCRTYNETPKKYA